MPTVFYAHSPKEVGGEPEFLVDHLRNVSDRAGSFADVFALFAWGKAAGGVHDLGKACAGFLKRLAGGKVVDHSTAGAKEARERYGLAGYLLAYAVAGHHGGLPDSGDLGARIAALAERSDPYDPSAGVYVAEPLPPIPSMADSGFGRMFLTRMIFSCLVDADRLETERFYNAEKAERRNCDAVVTETHRFALDRHLETLSVTAKAKGSKLAEERANILRQCRDASRLSPGFFTLAVPTGGGKTLASLAFAFDHIAAHPKLRRVISVIPYTSIIEQNAAVYASFLGDDVLEHHTGFRSTQRKATEDAEGPEKHVLAEENWDMPVVVTTSVQFFDSLFSNHPESCRKLHNVAGSVILLDEAHLLPSHVLKPCLEALKQLVHVYGCSVVFSTATLPAFENTDWFECGIASEELRPIINEPEALHQRMTRVKVETLGSLSEEALAGRLREQDRVLCIVNRRNRAKSLYERIADLDGSYHLSARMCPAHRRLVLEAIRRRLDSGLPCRIVSTSLIECGVDISLPVVFREMNGLDSLIQAAGRCNRELEAERGTLFVFQMEEGEGTLRGDEDRRIKAALRVLSVHADPFSPEAVLSYFRAFYDCSNLDTGEILKGPLKSAMNRRPQIDFATIAEHFHMIEADEMETVLVPFGAAGMTAVDDLRRAERVNRPLLRALQPYAVSLYRKEISALAAVGGLETLHGRFRVLSTAYDETLGIGGL